MPYALRTSRRFHRLGGGSGANPLTLYSAFDQNRIIDGWTLTEPTQPQGSLTNVTVTNDSQFSAAIALSNRRINISAGTTLGDFNINGSGSDNEINFGAGATMKALRVRGTGGVRWKINGGVVGKFDMTTRTDWTLDGVVINPNALWASGLSDGSVDTACFMTDCSRVAFLYCLGMGYTTGTNGPGGTGHGNVFLITRSNNLLFAKSNWAGKPSGGGSNNNWAFRFSNGTDGDPDIYNVVMADCMVKQFCQPIRLSGEIGVSNLRIKQMHFDSCTIVNVDQCNNAIHSQDTRGLNTDKICNRSCTFYLGDGGAGTQNLTQFGPQPAVWSSVGVDAKWYMLDSVFYVPSLTLASNTALATIESNCASTIAAHPTWGDGVSDCRLRAKASDYSSTSGAAFNVDANVHLLWPNTLGGSATQGLWQSVTSPTNGAVGDNPLKLG